MEGQVMTQAAAEPGGIFRLTQWSMVVGQGHIYMRVWHMRVCLAGGAVWNASQIPTPQMTGGPWEVASGKAHSLCAV